jgi:hypothetical protein
MLLNNRLNREKVGCFRLLDSLSLSKGKVRLFWASACLVRKQFNSFEEGQIHPATTFDEEDKGLFYCDTSQLNQFNFPFVGTNLKNS